MKKDVSDLKTSEYHRKRRVLGIVSLIIVLLLFVGATIFISKYIFSFSDAEEFKEYIQSFGWIGRFVLLGIQILQVIVALIPGELVEVGAGYAFGAVEGTLICIAGVAIASSIIFTLTKWLGIKLVEIFISREKINELRFINSEKKLKRIVFLLFFIPGTPKDLLTYFVGLTRIRLLEFLVISLIARIPSLVSSTIGGHAIGEKNYFAAVLIFAITGIVSLIGMKIYTMIVKHHKEHKVHEAKL